MSETWRVIGVDGEAHGVWVRSVDGLFVAHIDGNPTAFSAISPRNAVLKVAVRWEAREILAPGQESRAELEARVRREAHGCALTAASELRKRQVACEECGADVKAAVYKHAADIVIEECAIAGGAR